MNASDNIHPYGFHSIAEKPDRCEACGKHTDNLYCTPIGRYNWRCESCQNDLVHVVGYEECLDGKDMPMSYPEIPESYGDKYKIPITRKKGLLDYLKRL